MQAMNGSAASGIRSSAVRAVVCVGGAARADGDGRAVDRECSGKPPKPPKETYVGLGDSLAFGYSQQLFNENLVNGENPAGFEHGYVSDYYKDVDTQGRTELVNYGCPGETTESMIGDNPTFIAELNEKAGTRINQPITGEPLCAYHYGGRSAAAQRIRRIEIADGSAARDDRREQGRRQAGQAHLA